MTLARPLLALTACALLAACAPAPAATAPVATTASGPDHASERAVLIAGDGHLPVFDHAADDLSARLRADGASSAADIARLSAVPDVIARDGVRSATLDHTLDAIAAMRPPAGHGCLVFATSHGAPVEGVALSLNGEMLSPAALDRALVQGCGDAPTVVIVSACFSGVFTQPPMARANRVILTAARADRTSFGCGAGRDYTVYDRCLLQSMRAGEPWRSVHAAIRACVAGEERHQHFRPASQPQAWFGADVADLKAP